MGGGEFLDGRYAGTRRILADPDTQQTLDDAGLARHRRAIWH